MMSFRRLALAAVACIVAALAVSACGSSGGGSGSAGLPTSVGGRKQAGPGLTEPTAPSGARASNAMVTFAEGADAAPNYIFPMYSPQVCSVANISQLMDLMYRPLYWYGNNYSPTIDYDYSIGNQPVFSQHDTTVTIKLKPWKWSNGETVTSRDLVFWMNMMKADPAKEWCGYVKGYFPDNVTSYSAPDPSTFVMHLDRAYNPTWFTYNELSQLTPIPLAWDRTSLSQPAPTSDNGHLPDTTPAGAAKIYNFLDAQSKQTSTWTTSPLWTVVDGPWKLQSHTTQGQLTFVPNPSYSGTPKPQIAQFQELPFTSDTAVFNQIRSGGPSALTIAGLPPQDVPQLSTVEAEGYDDNTASSYSFNYFVLNFHNPTVGPIFSQLYFRQAFQSLIDQNGWISAFLNHTAVPTYSPVPQAPPSPLLRIGALSNPYPFSVVAATKYLTDNGWKVVPGGTTTCQKPGTGPGECGAGIKAGQAISFTLDYQSGVTSLTSEMNDLQAQAKKVGITINLTNHPFAEVISAAVACTANQPACKWQAQNWGAGWIYSPDYLPTGESLFDPGAVANYGSYYDPKATALIKQTIFGPPADENAALAAYAKYMAVQLPVVYGPTSIGNFGADGGTMISNKLGGYTANVFGQLTPEAWYLVK